MKNEILQKFEKPEIIWQDRKRHLGLPFSFTRYSMSHDRLFTNTGFANLNTDEVLMYRISDISVKKSLWQRIFGVGTVCVHSSDKTTPHLELKNIKKPDAVKELLHSHVEKAKQARRMTSMELVGDPGECEVCD